jgi:hypothetical protein
MTKEEARQRICQRALMNEPNGDSESGRAYA